MHARLAEVLYKAAQANAATATPQETARGYSESTRRYLRSIELCDNYLRGYYGLKLATKQLLEVLPNAKDAEGSIDLEKAELLNEISTIKLWDIVKQSSAGKSGWDGNDKAEIIAARALLDQDELENLGDASVGK